MMKQTLSAGLPGLNLELPEERIDTLVAFGRAMVKQNEVMNLTGITDDKGVANLHLLDSLTVLSTADLSGKTLIDVGCGAGFPGVPLAIAAPDAKITLLDSCGLYWLLLTPPMPGPLTTNPNPGLILTDLLCSDAGNKGPHSLSTLELSYD